MAWTEVVGVPTKAVEFYRYTKEFSIAIPLPDSQLAPNNVLNILSTRNLKDGDILIFPIAGVSDIDGTRVEDCCLFVDVVDQDGTLQLEQAQFQVVGRLKNSDRSNQKIFCEIELDYINQLNA